jgi:hypothetical protein
LRAFPKTKDAAKIRDSAKFPRIPPKSKTVRKFWSFHDTITWLSIRPSTKTFFCISCHAAVSSDAEKKLLHQIEKATFALHIPIPNILLHWQCSFILNLELEILGVLYLCAMYMYVPWQENKGFDLTTQSSNLLDGSGDDNTRPRRHVFHMQSLFPLPARCFEIIFTES